MSLNIVQAVIFVVALQSFVCAESRITIRNESYKDVLINIPALMQFNTAQNHFVSVYIMRTTGSKEEIIQSQKEIREGDLQPLPHGYMAQIEFAADFFLEYRDKEITFNLLQESFFKKSLLRVSITKNYLFKKLKRGELVISTPGMLPLFALRAWYVVNEENIICEHYYRDKED